MESSGPGGVLGQSVWLERAFSFLSPDEQRAAISYMGVIVVKNFYYYVWVSLSMGSISYLDYSST